LSDGDRTYLIYNYNGTSLPFDGARTSYIGWTAPKDNFHHQLSGTSNAGNIFEELGNTGQYIFILCSYLTS
jgi:hypothetical protein